MSKKLSAIIGLLLTVVMFASFSIGNFEAEAAVSASYDTYLADFLLNDATAQSYINREYSIPYRKYVEDRRNSLTYTAMLEAWEILTFDAKLADKSGKCVAYYETILYDTIYGGLDGNSELNDLTSKVSSVKASTMKTLMEYSEDLVDYELEDIKKGTDLYNTLIKEFVACEALKDAFENISDLKDQLDKCKDLYEAVEKVAKVEALVENQEQIKKIVTDIGNSTANPALKLACARMTVIMDDVIPDQIIAGVFASESTIGEAVDDGFKAVWDAVLVDVAGAKLTIAVKTGQKSGKLAAGMLFSTDKDVEHVYAMDALYDIEDITVNLVKRYQSQYKSNPTQANAKLYTEAFKQLIKTYIEGVDYSKTYAEITNEQGLINQIFKKFESDDYKRFINMLDNMRLTYEDYLNYIDVCVYNNYLADVPNETVKKKVKIVKKATETTDADIMSYFDTYKTVDALYTNRVVKEEWVLTEDYTTHGSLTVEADIDLNGHTLTVGGDLTHLEGDILIHNGSLIISGDYLATKISTDSNGKIIYGNTSNNPVLRMVWENDYVFVGGDFRVNPYPLNNCALSEGVLEIQGGFYFYASNHSYGSNRYHFTENNTVILSGTDDQIIYMENTNCSFNNLKIMNIDKRNIITEGFITIANEATGIGNKLSIKSQNSSLSLGMITCSNIDVLGNVSFHGTTKLNGKSTLINGSMNCNGNVDINGEELSVTGDLTHLEGDILIHNGSLIISGDYLATKISTDSNGKIIYGNTSNNPVLRMVWENDYVFVGGDFRVNPYPLNNCALSEGVLEIQGGFYFYASNHSYGSNRYHFTENNTVVFSGNKNQTIYVENSNCTFNKVEFKNNDSMTINITGFFKSNNGIIVNYGNVTIKSDNTNANVTDIFMRAGAKVTLTGNMNGFNSINKASFSSNMADYVSVSASTITAESVGDAEVTVTNNDGDSIINLTVEKPFELGDVNRDGEITVADAVILQKWILAVPNTRLSDWKLCDLCEDEEINVFDLCLLKRKLINS